MCHKIRHRKRKMRHPFRYPSALQARTVLRCAQRGAPARLQGIFISSLPPTQFPSIPQFASRWQRIAVLRITIAGLRTAHKVTEGVSLKLRTSESDLAVFTADDATKRPEHQNSGATRRFYHKKPPRIVDARRKTRHQRNRVLRH